MDTDFLSSHLPIDNVTIDNLGAALRILGIDLTREQIDVIIDAVELLEQKGDDASLKEILELKAGGRPIGFIK